MKRFVFRLFVKHYKNNTAVRNFLALLSLDILVKAGIVLLIPIYTHVMKREEFGLFNYLFFYISTVSLIFNFGLYAAQTKLLNQNVESEHQRINGTIFSFFLLPAAILSLLLLITNTDIQFSKWLFYHNPINFSDYRFAIQFAVFSSAFGFMINSWLLAVRKVRLIQKMQLGKFLVHIPVIIGLYIGVSDAVLFRLWAFYFLDFLISLVIFISEKKHIHWKPDPKYYHQIWIISLPILLNSLLNIIFNLLDKIYLENSSFQNQMPSYALAVQIASIIPIISISFLNVMLPDFLKETDLESSYAHTKRTQKRLFVMLSATGFLILLGFLVAIYLKIFPESYFDVITVLWILILSKVIEAMAQLFVRYTVYLKKTWISLLYSLIAAPAVIFLNHSFVPEFGMLAAAGVSLFSSVFTYLYFRIYISFEVYQKLKH